MPQRLCVSSFENRRFLVLSSTTSLSCAYNFNSCPNQNLCFKLPWSTVPLISSVRTFHREGRYFCFLSHRDFEAGILLGENLSNSEEKYIESVHKPASVTGRLQHKLPKARRYTLKTCPPFPCHFFMPSYLLRGLGSARYIAHCLYCHCEAQRNKSATEHQP